MSNNRFDGEMLRLMNERNELERFRDQHSQDELDDFVAEFRGLWTPFFEEEMSKEVPRHPWKVLKEARKTYAERENNGDWPCMEKRHALRVVKDEFVVKWESYKESF